MQNVKKKPFPILKILVVQAVVVGVLAAVLFAVKKVAPAEYETLAKQYVDVAQNEAQGKENIQKAWSKIKAFFVDENNKKTTENAGGKDEDANGNKTVYEIIIREDNYDIHEK